MDPAFCSPGHRPRKWAAGETVAATDPAMKRDSMQRNVHAVCMLRVLLLVLPLASSLDCIAFPGWSCERGHCSGRPIATHPSLDSLGCASTCGGRIFTTREPKGCFCWGECQLQTSGQWAPESGLATTYFPGALGRRQPTSQSIIGSPLVIDSKALNDSLYAQGYHNNTKIWHAEFLVKELVHWGRRKLIGSHATVLDLGCSHGKAVEELWQNGLVANGVDISSIAVALANRTRQAKGRCGGSRASRSRARCGCLSQTATLTRSSPRTCSSICRPRTSTRRSPRRVAPSRRCCFSRSPAGARRRQSTRARCRPRACRCPGSSTRPYKARSSGSPSFVPTAGSFTT